MLDFPILRRFLAVVEHGNVTRAAERLRIAQPALTRSIKKLEDELHVTLFERTSRGVEPTVYAQQFARYARAILNDIRRADEELGATKGLLSGHVTFGVTPNYSYDLAPDAVLMLRKKWPNLRVTVHEGFLSDMAERVRSSELDFAFGLLTPPHAGIELTDLVHEVIIPHQSTVVARAGHPLATQRQVSLAQLAEHDWVVLGPEIAMGPYFREKFTSRGITPPRQVIVARSLHFLKRVLLESDLLAILAPNSVAHDLANGAAVILPCPDASVVSETGFISLDRMFEAPAVKAMKHALRRQISKLFESPELKFGRVPPAARRGRMSS